ncbi:CoA transferase [Stakelama tenebrarum]|uniref:CoA transferase n=1 Tax=Stakelama tenebrarum TaxID=2711215 RepID=A0A6G6Y823_9SPHN|nr:CoA transferase [Sphingosinithalassobacter tenebrarum]QIG80723.1 CoA transferase [Sphingosinithalassobacter tenebrarum]
MPLTIPLADVADGWVKALAQATGSEAIAALDGATLLGERAMLNGFAVPGRVSPGGGCRLYEAADGVVALNLARESDRELLPALFEQAFDPADDTAITGQVAQCEAPALVARGREMGLAIAAETEPAPPCPAVQRLVEGKSRAGADRPPRVIDLSALWAGPLAGHLLWLAGADVVKVESDTRPDAMREGDPALFALLNQGKASISLDLKAAEGRRALMGLIAQADIIVEAARPRALRQLGIDAAALVAGQPGLIWLTITGHGARGDAADWVGFGDDCGVAAGLSAELRAASGASGFAGDAVADPLTGIRAASVAWDLWQTGHGGRFGLSMRGVTAEALGQANADGPETLTALLRAWRAAEGKPFPGVTRRSARAVAPRGADTRRLAAGLASC